MFQSFNFDKEANDSQNYYYFTEGFSKEELNQIENDVKFLPFEDATTAGNNKKVRSSKIKWVPQEDKWWWLYEKMSNMAVEANNALWNFDLYTIPEQIQYTEYYATEKKIIPNLYSFHWWCKNWRKTN